MGVIVGGFFTRQPYTARVRASVSSRSLVDAAGSVVRITDATITDEGLAGFQDAQAGIRINADGTVDRYLLNGGGYAQINASTDWIIPNSNASSAYSVEATEVSFTGGGTRAGDMNTELNLGSAREWSITRLQGAAMGTSEWVIDLTIRYNSGSPPLNTGRITLRAVTL